MGRMVYLKLMLEFAKVSFIILVINLANLFAKYIMTAVSYFIEVSVVLPPVAANISPLTPA
jgi:hypothetical protein